jgi:hypothetical protein
MESQELHLLLKINPGQSMGQIKPHKYALMLAIIKLYERQPSRPNRFHITKELEATFEFAFRTLSPDLAFSSAMLEAPFFYLQNDGLWFLHIKPGKEDDFKYINLHKNGRFTKKRLLDIFSHASLDERLHLLLGNRDAREKVKGVLMDMYTNPSSSYEGELARLQPHSELGSEFNPFVGYLNSLQRSGGGNENALAESQVCNAQFATIHVKHPLADIIYEEMRDPGGQHVLLTGHAGDGKSTLAMEVYKLFRDWDRDRPLDVPPQPREDTGDVSIIKDLSERDRNEDPSLLDELSKRERRFLLVSNTGTLLDLAKRHSAYFGEKDVEVESRVLKAISSESGESTLSLGGIKFRVFNLARMDNMALARRVFEKMLAPERWTICQTLDCRETCPIFINVNLLQSNQERATERIFLAYRRMYEYGTRLTMRQFTEHLAYLITSGLDQQDIRKVQTQNPPPLISEYLFFNRFFGDNGCEPDGSAFEMKAVQEIEKQKFGERPCPGWEHKLWLRNCDEPVTLGVNSLNAEFEKLRRHGAHESQFVGMSSDQAREQVRRMLYFLADFPEGKQGYLGQYLNSPTLLDWIRWQHDGVHLEFQEKNTLERKIYHVLQEHFTGVRLPEGSTQNDRRLYVTLSRRRSEVRQSAQVVLAEFDWVNSTALKLAVTESATGEQRKDLVLHGKDRIDGLKLPLKVPFLDYVMMRHFGELGEVLEASYLERLDCFKAQVQQKASAHDDERIMLVRLKTDHTFRRQRFAVNGNNLEVTDDL